MRQLATTFLPSALLVLAVAASAGAYSFDTGTNEGWRSVGFYDGGGLTPLPAPYFWDMAAPWFDMANAPDHYASSNPDPMGNGLGCIGIGSGGMNFPPSPTGNAWIHWDLVSPDLSGYSSWQGPGGFRYSVEGKDVAMTGDAYVQAVLHIKKSNGVITYWTDGAFNQIHTYPGTPDGWTSYTFNTLALPSGSTILGLSLRFFLQSGSPYSMDGYILADDIQPFIYTWLHAGDANADGKVSVGDLGILAANYGKMTDASWAQGDFNKDGAVSVGDLGILAANYGYGTAALPEPLTLSLLALGALALARRRR